MSEDTGEKNQPPKKGPRSTGLLSFEELLRQKPGAMSPSKRKRRLEEILPLTPVPDTKKPPSK